MDLLKLCDEHDPSGTTVAYSTLDDSDVAFVERIRREGRATSA
jgi:hypothetical protein